MTKNRTQNKGSISNHLQLTESSLHKKQKTDIKSVLLQYKT